MLEIRFNVTEQAATQFTECGSKLAGYVHKLRKETRIWPCHQSFQHCKQNTNPASEASEVRYLTTLTNAGKKRTRYQIEEKEWSTDRMKITGRKLV